MIKIIGSFILTKYYLFIRSDVVIKTILDTRYWIKYKMKYPVSCLVSFNLSEIVCSSNSKMSDITPRFCLT